jgi:hypothetical protein
MTKTGWIEERKNLMSIKSFNNRYDVLDKQLEGVFEAYDINSKVECFENVKEGIIDITAIVYVNDHQVVSYTQPVPDDADINTSDNCVENLIKQVVASTLTYAFNQPVEQPVGPTPVKLFDEDLDELTEL